MEVWTYKCMHPLFGECVCVFLRKTDSTFFPMHLPCIQQKLHKGNEVPLFKPQWIQEGLYSIVSCKWNSSLLLSACRNHCCCCSCCSICSIRELFFVLVRCTCVQRGHVDMKKQSIGGIAPKRKRNAQTAKHHNAWKQRWIAASIEVAWLFFSILQDYLLYKST